MEHGLEIILPKEMAGELAKVPRETPLERRRWIIAASWSQVAHQPTIQNQLADKLQKL
jgi:hypothetical protein